MLVSNWSKVPEAEFSGVLRLRVTMEANSNVLLNVYELTKGYITLGSVKNWMSLSANFVMTFGFEDYVLQFLSCKLHYLI